MHKNRISAFGGGNEKLANTPTADYNYVVEHDLLGSGSFALEIGKGNITATFNIIKTTMQCPNHMTSCVGLPKKNKEAVSRRQNLLVQPLFCCAIRYLTQRTCQIITVRASCNAILVLFLV